MHMMSHVKVHSSTTYLIMLAGFGEIPMEIYALKPNIGIQQELATYLPLDSSVKQPYFPDTLPNQVLTPGANSQPCGRHHGVYLIGKPMTTYTIKITTDDLEKAFLAKEWNTFHLSRKKLDYLHLKDFSKSKCESCCNLIGYAFFFYNVVENEAHFVIECPLYNFMGIKFQSLFEKLVIECPLYNFIGMKFQSLFEKLVFKGLK